MADDQEEHGEELESGTWRDRLDLIKSQSASRAESLESRYLSLLRYSLLIIASLLLVVAAAYLAWGLFSQIGSSEVDPEPISLTATDIAPATPEDVRESDDEVIDDAKFKLSDPLRKKTLQVYRASFAKFERDGEKAEADQIIQTVWPEERRLQFDQIAGIELKEAADLKTDLSSGENLAQYAIGLVGKATEEDGFTKSLTAYRSAEKVKVCRDVTRQRKRTVTSWDRYSTSCPNWYYSPIGCSSTRTVNEPYTVKKCEMQFPKNLDDPKNAMATALDQFLLSAAVKSEDALYDAEALSAEKKSAKVEGRKRISDSGKLFLAFLALMLLYLLVVIERHHRLLRGLVPDRDDG